MATDNPTDEEWIESLAPEARAKAEAMIEDLAALKASGPISRVRSEINEGLPQTCCFLLLSALRRVLSYHKYHDLKGSTLPNTLNLTQIDIESRDAVKRLRALGADPNDIARIARATVVDALDEVVNILDDGRNWDAPEHCPRWVIAEVDGDNLTGRTVDWLHESILNVFKDDAELQLVPGYLEKKAGG